MCNGLNLCAIFWERDLINGTGAHKRKVTRNTTPEAQECCCRGAALCRCWLGAALRWALLLRLGINIWRIITAVIAFGIGGRVAVIGSSNENRACIGDECAKLSESCMRLNRGEVENLSSDLRVRAGGITRCLCINEWPWSTR
jgi:hypothetical protein